MNRRDFLKVSGVLSMSAYVAISPIGNIINLPLEAVSQGKVYRGTINGDIHLSKDGGASWQLHTSFGPDCPILNVFKGSDGWLYAHVGFKLYTFHLMLSQDEKVWLTAPQKISMLDLI